MNIVHHRHKQRRLANAKLHLAFACDLTGSAIADLGKNSAVDHIDCATEFITQALAALEQVKAGLLREQARRGRL